MVAKGANGRSWIGHGHACFDYDSFCSRLKVARVFAGFPLLSGLCAAARMPLGTTKDMLEACEQDFRPYVDALDELVAPLGRTAEWLVTGRSLDNAIAVGIREQSHIYIEEFIRKEDPPTEDWQRIHNYIDNRIKNSDSLTAQGIYRAGAPSTWRDVKYLYEEMLQFEG